MMVNEITIENVSGTCKFRNSEKLNIEAEQKETIRVKKRSF